MAWEPHIGLHRSALPYCYGCFFVALFEVDWIYGVYARHLAVNVKYRYRYSVSKSYQTNSISTRGIEKFCYWSNRIHFIWTVCIYNFFLWQNALPSYEGRCRAACVRSSMLHAVKHGHVLQRWEWLGGSGVMRNWR